MVKNTRLATSAGAIYRLDSAVLIPGYKKQNSEIIPGSATAGITADVAGPGGNIETADFSLPGLAGTPQASKIYARTKTAITGGASGKLYVLSDEAAESAKDTLSKKLKDSLIAKTKVQIPNGYVFYESALKFTQDDDLSVPYSKDPDVPIAMSGSITAYLIKEETLIRALAGRFVTGYQGEPLEVIPKLESLALVPQTPVDISATEFQFALSGSALLKSIINEDEIKSAVVGQKKKDFENILKGIPSVESAIVTIHPFWKRSFPDNIKRIQITIENK